MDWSRAMQVVQGDLQLLQEIVRAFLEEYPRMLDDIRGSIEKRDGAVLQRAAHTLKGSMRYFGAAEAFDQAYALECMGKERRFAEAAQQMPKLRDAIERLQAVLVRFAETGKTSDAG